MDCKEFWKKYEQTGLNPELERHLEVCSGCRAEMEIELLLQQKVESLPDQKAPKRLWNRINDALPAGERQSEHSQSSVFTGIKRLIDSIFPAEKTVPLRPVIVGFVILLIMTGTISVKYYNVLNVEKKEQLQALAITEIEEKEQGYITEIEKLILLVEKKKDDINTDLFLLYRQKLAVLDEYIMLCQEAVERNQYNVNVRQYLVLAYQEKAEALKKLVEQIS